MILLLLKTIYGLKQAAYEYWLVLLKAMQKVGLLRNKADPCVYYRWTNNGLNIWSSWVDDILSAGDKKDVGQGREALKDHFELNEVGDLQEYVRCKVDYDREKGTMVLTQPVLIQSFEDKFNLEEYGNRIPNTPASPNTTLMEGETKLGTEKHHKYCKGVGKMIHLSKYSRPDILNAVQELLRHGAHPMEAHYTAMIQCMKYVVNTKDTGFKIIPHGIWDGQDKNFEFVIMGKSDSNFAQDAKTRHSISGYAAYLNGVTYMSKSQMQKFIPPASQKRNVSLVVTVFRTCCME